jgi:flagellar hook-length control protein FliK
MLLSINLPGAELSTIRGEPPVPSGLPADSTMPVGGFAELFGLRLPGDIPATSKRHDFAGDGDSGESLPVEGNNLPQASPFATDWGIEWTTTALTPALPDTIVAESVETAAKHHAGMPTPGDVANKPGTSLASRDLWWSAQLQRNAVSAATQTAANLAASSGADDSVMPQLVARPGRDVSRPVALPESLTGIDDARSLPSGDEGRSPDALLRRVTGNDDGNLRQQAVRDRLPAKPNFTMPVSAAISGDADSGAAPLAGASTGPAASSLPGNASLQLENISAVQPAAISPAPPVKQSAPAVLQRIDMPMQDPSWGDALNERVTFMAGKEIRNAEIRLNPAELGPIRVQVSVDDRGTSVTFAAHHALTRDAIEQALPRLRELFLDQGLSLGQASVSDQGVRQERDGQGADGAEPLGADTESDDTEVVQDATAGSGRRAGNGLVDTFA